MKWLSFPIFFQQEHSYAATAKWLAIDRIRNDQRPWDQPERGKEVRMRLLLGKKCCIGRRDPPWPGAQCRKPLRGRPSVYAVEQLSCSFRSCCRFGIRAWSSRSSRATLSLARRSTFVGAQNTVRLEKECPGVAIT